MRQILQFHQKKLWPDRWTLSPTFYDLSVSWNLFSKAGMRQFGAIGNQRIWDCQNQWVLSIARVNYKIGIKNKIIIFKTKQSMLFVLPMVAMAESSDSDGDSEHVPFLGNEARLLTVIRTFSVIYHYLQLCLLG